eukprot:COSAG04_NODE_226_length_19492_cov_9.475790_2_plen_1389_part_00
MSDPACECLAESEDCSAPGSDGAGCCSKSIRIYSRADEDGLPQELTAWTTYDHRQRPWYREALESPQETRFSSVYEFSTSLNLGITHTSKVRRIDGSIYGVMAVDFELEGLATILRDAVAGTTAWAFVVQRDSENAGKLLSSTFGAPLQDDVSGERCHVLGYCRSGGQTVAVIQQETIAAAARHLAAEDYRATRPGEVLTNTRGGVRAAGQVYEAVAANFTLRGIEWLIVVGTDINCAPHERWVFGACVDCLEGRVPLDDRTCTICSEALPGTVSDDEIVGGTGTKCVCPEGTYAVRSFINNTQGPASCEPCSELTSSIGGSLGIIDEGIHGGKDECPGSSPAHTRICPLEKLWIEVEEPSASGDQRQSTQVTLLTCPACQAGPCVNASTMAQQLNTSAMAGTAIDELNSSQYWSLQTKGLCKEHHTGFLCAECEENYKAIDGECALCDETDWEWVATEGIGAALIGLWLLRSTWQTVCKTADANSAFDVVDLEKNGFLSQREIQMLLVRMGNPIAAGRSFEATVAEMKGKQLGWCGASDQEKAKLKRASISRNEFHDWCAKNQDRGTVGMVIFFVQTFSLVTARSMNFKAMELVNLDLGKAVKICRIPDCGLFCGLLGLGVVPVVAGFSMFIGIWFMSTCLKKSNMNDALVGTRAGKPAGRVSGAPHDEPEPEPGPEADYPEAQSEYGLTDKRGLPMRGHHLGRGILQIYLATFAPVTRRCMELFMCRSTINDGVQQRRLVYDLSLECWVDKHLIAAVIAMVLLLIYAILIPAYLVKRARSRFREKERNAAAAAGLNPKPEPVQPCCWFNPKPEPQPQPQPEPEPEPQPEPQPEPEGQRERGCCYYYTCDPRTFLSKDRHETHTKPELKARMNLVATLNPSWCDEMVRATQDDKFFWFIFTLLLKLAVNTIFLLGDVLGPGSFDYGTWLQVLLMSAALLSHWQQPYLSVEDNRQEQMSFVGLSVVLSVTNSGALHGEDWHFSHVFVVVMVVVLSVATALYTEFRRWRRLQAREKRVAKGEKGKKKFWQDNIEKVFPNLFDSFDNGQKFEECIQIESFEKGDTIFSEGEGATSFYILYKGAVAVSSRGNDGQRVVEVFTDGGGDGGEDEGFGGGFGYSSLELDPSKQPKRLGTATATADDDVVCLRLIRSDWLNALDETVKDSYKWYKRLDRGDGTHQATVARKTFRSEDEYRQHLTHLADGGLAGQDARRADANLARGASDDGRSAYKRRLKERVDRLVATRDLLKGEDVETPFLDEDILRAKADLKRAASVDGSSAYKRRLRERQANLVATRDWLISQNWPTASVDEDIRRAEANLERAASVDGRNLDRQPRAPEPEPEPEPQASAPPASEFRRLLARPNEGDPPARPRGAHGAVPGETGGAHGAV